MPDSGPRPTRARGTATAFAFVPHSGPYAPAPRTATLRTLDVTAFIVLGVVSLLALFVVALVIMSR